MSKSALVLQQVAPRLWNLMGCALLCNGLEHMSSTCLLGEGKGLLTPEHIQKLCRSVWRVSNKRTDPWTNMLGLLELDTGVLFLIRKESYLNGRL